MELDVNLLQKQFVFARPRGLCTPE